MAVKILNAAQKEKIVKGRAHGQTMVHLAKAFNVSTDTISRVLKEAKAAEVPQDVRVIKFEHDDAEALVSDIKDAIKDRVQFVVDLRAGCSASTLEEIAEMVYDEYLGTPDGSAAETILDELDDEILAMQDGKQNIRSLVKVIFGMNQGFKNESETVVIDSPIKLVAAPLTPSQQDEKAYSDAIKASPKVASKAPEPIWNASSKFISITIGRNVYNADKDHPAFKQAHQLLVDGDILGAVDLINVEQAVTRFVDGDVRIEDGVLFFKDIELKTGLTDRIIGLMYEGKDFKFLLPFLHNLLENPSRKAVYRLFDFLEANDIEITKEGYFIAWKKVRSNWHDIHSGTMDNSPGKEVRVERNQVDEDDEVTCSHGLHVCSKSYLSHFGSWRGSNDRVVSVLVHPKDVVSIPVDYNNAKMRTAGYKVIAEVTSRFAD